MTTQNNLKSFKYQEREFTPYSTIDPVYFMGASKGLSEFKMTNFSHADFYKAAGDVGAEKYNVFQSNNMLLIPCASHFVVCCQ